MNNVFDLPLPTPKPSPWSSEQKILNSLPKGKCHTLQVAQNLFWLSLSWVSEIHPCKNITFLFDHRKRQNYIACQHQECFSCVTLDPLIGLHCNIKNSLHPKISDNKKVLLRERKRHTDRGVSSTARGGVPPVRVLPPGQVWRRRGGYPRWGTPCLGTPPARSNGGYPRWGTPIEVPLSQVWRGVSEMGYPPLGYPPTCGVLPLSGHPPPPARSDVSDF